LTRDSHLRSAIWDLESVDKLKHIGHSNLLREDRRLAPSDGLRRREPVVMNDPEVSFRFTDDFERWMALKAEKYFEKSARY